MSRLATQLGTLLVVLVWLALAVADDEPRAAWSRGMGAIAQQDWTAAERHFRTYRESAPDDPAGWVMEGYALWQTDRREEAVSRFETAIGLDPGQPDALYYLAESAWREGPSGKLPPVSLDTSLG